MHLILFLTLAAPGRSTGGSSKGGSSSRSQRNAGKKLKMMDSLILSQKKKKILQVLIISAELSILRGEFVQRGLEKILFVILSLYTGLFF